MGTVGAFSKHHLNPQRAAQPNPPAPTELFPCTSDQDFLCHSCHDGSVGSPAC